MPSTTLNTNTTTPSLIGVTIVGVGIGFEKKVRVSVWRSLKKEKRLETLCCTFLRRIKEVSRIHNTVMLGWALKLNCILIENWAKTGKKNWFFKR